MVAKYPAIPEPTIEPTSLRDAVLSLKQAFEILTGQRGNPNYAAITSETLPAAAEAVVTPPVTTLPAGSITVTPAGNIASTNVQAALAELDTEKVAKAGDTMTGHLSLPVTPAAANAVRKDYVDSAITAAPFVELAGDTMTGHLSLPITPAAANAVRRDYVDAADTTLAGRATALEARSSKGFHANKNGTDQLNGSAAIIKVTFTNEVFDDGNYYDTTLSRWTPPAGLVQLSCATWHDTGSINLHLYKNGAQLRGAFQSAAGNSTVFAITDKCNGTDYYEVFATVGTTPFTVKGSVFWTYFSGYLV